MFVNFVKDFFALDNFSNVMIGLTIFLSVIVLTFSKTYMKDDCNDQLFLARLLLFISVLLYMLSEATLFLLPFLAVNNYYFIELASRKSSWSVVHSVSRFLRKKFIISFIVILIAFIFFFFKTGHYSIQGILENSDRSIITGGALVLVFWGAMMQSALWPFHHSIIGAANFSTPVLALAHTLVVNSGLLLLFYFVPLYLFFPSILCLIFVVGVCSVLFGTVLKCIQSNVRSALAYSTISHMGMVYAFFGLQQFSLALLYLVCHSMVKAYLVLTSSSFVSKKSQPAYIQVFNLLFLAVVSSYCAFYSGNGLYFAATAICILVYSSIVWLSVYSTDAFPEWVVCIYVKMLNITQPDSSIVTAYRNDYSCKTGHLEW